MVNYSNKFIDLPTGPKPIQIHCCKGSNIRWSMAFMQGERVLLGRKNVCDLIRDNNLNAPVSAVAVVSFATMTAAHSLTRTQRDSVAHRFRSEIFTDYIGFYS